ncbi:hypothetical protein [Neptunitalea lumnitzerae]|uniref:Uncharacterized protein n=1 Tax=Neptunitalea lumnitzerae TaxID=2965509 RepID=A0ABQ5MKW6_9FLAO|nr:hypothetical protein [Neptunitalea sp. Y10]GLB50053.1 hypothetical protein Y10_24210 [Neptunitalea sp. Y10]
MDNFKELQDIWKSGGSKQLPDVKSIISKAKKDQKSLVSQFLIAVACMLLSIFVIVWVGITYDFEMITTYIGIVLVLITVVGYSAIMAYQTYKLKRIDMSASPEKVIPLLEERFQFAQLLATKGMVSYYLLLNIALILYFLEVMAPMKPMLKTICISVYVAWMFIAYFVLGKRQREKQYAKYNRMLDGLKQMQQLYTEEKH